MNVVVFGSEKFPLKIEGIQLPCFILDNGQPVFLKSGIQKAFGYDGKSDHWLLDLLSNIEKFSPLPQRLLESVQNPMLFEMTRGRKKTEVCEGITPEVFIDACQSLIDAKTNGYLSVGELKVSKSAEKICSHLNSSNITELIGIATGFHIYKENMINYLQRYLTETLNDDAFLWTKTFPEQFFMDLFQIYGLDWSDMKQNPHAIGRTIHEIVFSRIPNEVLEMLRSKKPKRIYQRRENKPQEILLPELKQYLTSLSALIEASGNNNNIFVQLLNRAHPKNPLFATRFPVFSGIANNEALSDFNSSLKRLA